MNHQASESNIAMKFALYTESKIWALMGAIF
jgi:hypothetical protein